MVVRDPLQPQHVTVDGELRQPRSDAESQWLERLDAVEFVRQPSGPTGSEGHTGVTNLDTHAVTSDVDRCRPAHDHGDVGGIGAARVVGPAGAVVVLVVDGHVRSLPGVTQDRTRSFAHAHPTSYGRVGSLAGCVGDRGGGDIHA